ncbi:MAG: hypothetical protein WC658_05050, partial [Candidatus Omnitrophota bacterium]
LWFNPVASYNIEIFSGFVLSGFFVFILVDWILKNKLAAFFAACIFAFCPYHFARAWQHIGLAHTQWLPLSILAALRLREHASKFNVFFYFISLYLVFSFDLYYGYFISVVTALFIIYMFFTHKREALKGSMLILSVFFFNLIIIVIQALPALKLLKFNSSPGAWAVVRPFEDLFSQSARPLSYFLPAPVHPVFGSFTEQLVGTRLYGESFTEHVLYLGWAPLILAFFAFRKWIKKRKEIKQQRAFGTVPCGDSPWREDFYIGFFIFLAIVAWLFSQPPWWQIAALKLYMPSFFMYKVMPIFRAYCRFGILVMLAVAILAGFGLKFLLQRFKAVAARATVTVFFCGLVLFEFWSWPPYKVIDLSKVPAVYYWLREQPGDFAIAEYPLDIRGPKEEYKFFQTAHEKKIINGTTPGTYANNVARSIYRLSGPDTAGVLKWMGVKYALVHQEGYLETGLIEDKEELGSISRNPGLKLINNFPVQDCVRDGIMCVQKTGKIDVYEVIAAPIKPRINE